MDLNESSINFKKKLYDEVSKHSLIYEKLPLTQPAIDQKRLATKKLLIACDIRKTLGNDVNYYFKDFCLTLLDIDPGLAIKYIVGFEAFSSCISRLGTEQHSDYYKRSISGEIIGGFSLTEIGHGSDTKRMKTYAKYDKNTKEFVLNSPNFLAAKCWMGNGGICCTHSIVYAQLITPDNINHGLHAFIVNVRDPRTLIPYPGVTIGDIGEKIGLQSIDNGFLMFHEYRISKASLLNRLADVTDDGTYVSHISDRNKRFAISMGILSANRVTVVGMNVSYLKWAVTSAIRYVFLQNNEQLKNIAYEIHQIRLIPHLSTLYVNCLMYDYMHSVHNRLLNSTENENLLMMLGKEFHTISSSGKCVLSWNSRDALQDCKEVCQNLGYFSELGSIFNNGDPNATFEGDNHVLIQQASNWLLSIWYNLLKGSKIDYPLLSVNYLNDAQQILRKTFCTRSLLKFITPQSVLEHYEWLTCFLLNSAYEKFESMKEIGKDLFLAKQDCQIYYLKPLSEAYILTFCIRRGFIATLETKNNLTPSFEKLICLYGIWNLQKFVKYFYQGGYANDSEFGKLLEKAVLELCKELKDHCLVLADNIAEPNLFPSIKSQLNDEDLVYKALESKFAQFSGTFSQFKWNDDIGDLKRCLSKL